MPVKHGLQSNEDQLWEPGLPAMAVCQALNRLQVYHHRRQASSHRRPHRLLGIQRLINQHLSISLALLNAAE
jgi:hypothetical protein